MNDPLFHFSSRKDGPHQPSSMLHFFVIISFLSCQVYSKYFIHKKGDFFYAENSCVISTYMLLRAAGRWMKVSGCFNPLWLQSGVSSSSSSPGRCLMRSLLVLLYYSFQFLTFQGQKLFDGLRQTLFLFHARNHHSPNNSRRLVKRAYFQSILYQYYSNCLFSTPCAVSKVALGILSRRTAKGWQTRCAMLY